jgi:outer membrane protein OmpA-like peptidoglycan-associated protein
MMRTPICLAIIAMLLTACASERVVLLPSQNGRPSAVVVKGKGGEQVIDRPYASVLNTGSSSERYQASRADISQRFGAALAAQPERPQSYLVYFEEGGDQLTPNSRAEFARIKAELARRPAAEIIVVGHTDRVGSVADNDVLSQKRAVAVREQLIAAGLPGERIEAFGRGEREPLVATDDEVDEPQNRRVEITVR